MHFIFCRKFFNVITFNFFLNLFSSASCVMATLLQDYKFLPGPSRRLAPVIKCNVFLSFQSYIVRDISLTEIYCWLVTFGYTAGSLKSYLPF